MLAWAKFRLNLFTGEYVTQRTHTETENHAQRFSVSVFSTKSLWTRSARPQPHLQHTTKSQRPRNLWFIMNTVMSIFHILVIESCRNS